MSALRDKILAAMDLPRTPVEVPEWDCTVYVRTLSARDMNRALAVVGKDHHDFETMVILGCVDEDGKPVFTEDDREAIGDKNNKVMRRLIDEITRINFTNEQEVAKQEAAFPE